MSERPQTPAANATIRLGQGPDRPRLKVQRVRLVVTAGPDRGREVALDKAEVRVGKGADNDLVLSDPAVSRNQFTVRPEGRRHHLSDLGSTNGTRIDGILAQEAVLDKDCTIVVGGTSIRFETVATELLVPDSTPGTFNGLIGVSRAMQDLFAYMQLVARAGLSTILQGETGSGKELVARALHQTSARAGGPFVVFDCSATNSNLVDAALFGHVAGAYTGASGSRKGAFVSADGGTLFLDEIGELPLDLQPKLLRVLERREVQPLGQDVPVRIQVGVVCATHRNLAEMVAAGRFREDLLYRLGGVTLVIPPLRERPEDIPVLAEHFLREARPELSLGAGAAQILSSHAWPGNVRELRNVVERTAALVQSTVIQASDVVIGSLKTGGQSPEVTPVLDSIVKGAETEAIRRALRDAGGNQSEAARKLEIARTTLRRKMADLGIDDGDE